MLEILAVEDQSFDLPSNEFFNWAPEALAAIVEYRSIAESMSLQGESVMDDDRSDDRTYDFFKHLTTLNTAAILLALTLLEKFIEVTDAERAQLMFFEFGVSLLASLAMMIFYSFFRESYFSGRSMGCLPTCASLLAIGFFLRGVWDLVGVVMAGFPQVP